MRQITDIKELRQIQMGILDHLHQFCTSHQIKYSLAFGTMLGAIRHKGYIPWDDDIDICMPRADYERFLKCYQDTEYFQLKDRSRSKDYYFTFAKVVDSRTYLVEDEIEGYHIGVWVDIFPIDYVADSPGSRKRTFFFKNVLYKMRMCKLLRGNHLHSVVSYLGYRFFPLPVSVVDRLIRCLIIRKQPTRTMGCMTENCRSPKQCFPATVFADVRDLTFEGKTYCGVSDADTYLNCLYGDYMQLPPEDQRTTHHFEAYVIQPDYQA